MAVKYAVLTKMAPGEWSNIWTEFSKDNHIVPTLFDSYDEALEELEQHLQESEDMRSSYSGAAGVDSYKIAKLVGDSYEDASC